MKKSKKNYVAIVLVVLLVAMAVGYAAFSGSISVSGTANASGKWDVKFKADTAKITNSIVTGIEANSFTIDEGGKSATAVVNLGTTGDGANLEVVIENKGTYDAKLTGFKVEGEGFEDQGEGVWKNGAILVKVPTIADVGTNVIAADANKTFKFSVEWDESVTELGSEKQTATFKITFDYEQANVKGTFNGVQEYNDTL